jgi:beta-glucuronidase
MGAVSHTAHVFWDGKVVGSHYNAFTGFDILLKDVEPGAHLLQVDVDNRFTEDSTLHIPNDYYTYGGITRSVELHSVGNIYLERMAFHCTRISGMDYKATVRLYLRAIEDTENAAYSVKLGGVSASGFIGHLAAGKVFEQEVTFTVPDVQQWDLFQPHLYILEATLTVDGVPVDDLTDRVGFRTVDISGEQILLNGKPVYLKGFNRHEDHGLFGCALPREAMMDDLQRILDTGANSIRTAHYPNDPLFLDLCDELGLLVWEEHHARAIPIEILRKSLFRKQISDCNIEMVTQHCNHPCIYIWGVLNECESATEEGRQIYAAQLAHLRQLDPTRPVSFASCRHFRDICLDLVDVVSWNIYPRWYVAEAVESYACRLLTWLEENGAAGKPGLITEVGAGGIAGYHDPFGRAKWSEERQSDILDEQLSVLLQEPRLSGVYIWQFADVRVSEEWSHTRPKTQNNKGIVDLFRQPKLSYQTVKTHFKKY